MPEELEIEFDQLVKIARRLPPSQWTKLKKEVEEEKINAKQDQDLIESLLSAPTYTKEQLEEVGKTRKAINGWRKK